MNTTCKDTNYRVWEVCELRIFGSPLYRDNKICSQQWNKSLHTGEGSEFNYCYVVEDHNSLDTIDYTHWYESSQFRLEAMLRENGKIIPRGRYLEVYGTLQGRGVILVDYKGKDIGNILTFIKENLDKIKNTKFYPIFIYDTICALKTSEPDLLHSLDKFGNDGTWSSLRIDGNQDLKERRIHYLTVPVDKWEGFIIFSEDEEEEKRRCFWEDIFYGSNRLPYLDNAGMSDANLFLNIEKEYDNWGSKSEAHKRKKDLESGEAGKPPILVPGWKYLRYFKNLDKMSLEQQISTYWNNMKLIKSQDNETQTKDEVGKE